MKMPKFKSGILLLIKLISHRGQQWFCSFWSIYFVIRLLSSKKVLVLYCYCISIGDHGPVFSWFWTWTLQDITSALKASICSLALTRAYTKCGKHHGPEPIIPASSKNQRLLLQEEKHLFAFYGLIPKWMEEINATDGNFRSDISG